MKSLLTPRARLDIMAEAERLRRVAGLAEVDNSVALACLERAERLERDLRLTEGGNGNQAE